MPDSWNPNGAGGRLSGAEAAELSRQLAGLTRASLPLAPGLHALGEELPAGRLRQSMEELANTLEQGVSLDKAVEEQKDRIPPHLRGLVIAGVRSGELGEILGRFSRYVNIGTELKRRLWLSLAYPALTASLTFVLFVFLSVGVVRQFEFIYKDFNIPLPFLTQLVLVASRGTTRIWPTVASILVALFVAWLVAHLLLSPATRRSMAASVPLLGGVWRATTLAEFCHLLALLLESRLAVAEALRLAGEGVQDAGIEDSCRQMAEQVEAGRSLADAMARRRRFPPGLPRLLRWAEKHMSLPEVLHMAGSMYEGRAASLATFVGVVLNTFCALLVLTMLLVIPALFLPLITLISKLSG
jgi:type II secretory pathway component PulF